MRAVNRSTKPQMSTVTIIGVFLLGLSTIAPAQTNLLQNGSMESGNLSGTLRTLYALDESIDNWRVVSGSVDYISEPFWEAADGTRSLDMSGHEAGAIEQDFLTVAGRTYGVIFDMAGNPDGGGTKVLRVAVADVSEEFPFDATGMTRQNMGWVEKTFLFTAVSFMDTIRLESLNNSSGGPALDNVRIIELETNCIPSTTNLCLNAGRFKVEAVWRDFQGDTGIASVVPVFSADSGLLWFFNSDNWEILIKVLDGCRVNGRIWVFAAATTNVEYTVTVTDTETGVAKEYFNSLGTSAAAITDTDAFAACP